MELNDLLASLSLPITVSTPYDLTPSLLLAILESILRTRLPISDATRESRTGAAKVEAMKVLLGVLEDDVLRTDIGLSDIDPRRLARGEWDEVVFVGETLCWLGRREVREAVCEDEACPAESSSAGSVLDTSLCTGFSRCDASDTNATTVPPSGSVLDISGASRGAHASARPAPPRCIHEVESSLDLFEDEGRSADVASADGFCDCSLDATTRGRETRGGIDSRSSPHSQPTIRYEGVIEPVEDDVEAFEAWRAHERSRSRTAQRVRSPTEPADIVLTILRCEAIFTPTGAQPHATHVAGSVYAVAAQRACPPAE